MVHALLVVFSSCCLAVLSACGLSRGTAEPVMSYVLDVEEARGTLTPDPSQIRQRSILLVTTPEPAPGFESQRMAYKQKPHEVQYFAASQWVDSPARLLAPLIINTLENSGDWSAVIQRPSVVRGDYRLDISGVVLIQDFTRQPSAIRLAVRAQLATVHDSRFIGTKSFDIWETAPSEDAYGGVQAAHKAVSRFVSELRDWLREFQPNT